MACINHGSAELAERLDSGFRRNDRRLGSGLCRTVTAFLSRVFQTMTGLFVHCHTFCSSAIFLCPPRRHSSEGWNPGRRAEGLIGCRFLSACARLTECPPLMSFPHAREWIIKTTGFRPAPACCRQAGMTTGLESGLRRLASIIEDRTKDIDNGPFVHYRLFHSFKSTSRPVSLTIIPRLRVFPQR